MNSILKLTGLMAVAFTLAASAVQAQTSEANSAAQAVSASQSGSIAQGGSVVFNTPSEQRVTSSGKTTVETAPSLGGLALGGSHPCQWSPFTGQISIVGGGLGGGGGEIDSACMLLVASAAAGDAKAYAAAMSMIAARDPAACKAMYQSGMVSDCVDKQGKSTVRAAQPKARATAPTTVGYSKCEKAAGNKVVIRYKNNANKALARSQCLTTLGY